MDFTSRPNRCAKQNHRNRIEVLYAACSMINMDVRLSNVYRVGRVIITGIILPYALSTVGEYEIIVIDGTDNANNYGLRIFCLCQFYQIDM